MADLALRDVMNPQPLVVGPRTTMTAAAAAMAAQGVGSAVVTEGDRVVGIVTERDLARATAAGVDPVVTPVSAWMTPSPVTMSAATEITRVLDEMIERNFRHVPVLDDGALVGIVSLRRLTSAARLRRVDPWSPSTTRGLENVTVAETVLSHIDGTAGRLVYRGYDAVELALGATFEDVWSLLHRDVVRADAAFLAEARGARTLPLTPETLRGLAAAPGPFMAKLQAAIAATGAAWGVVPWHERDPDESTRLAFRLTAVLPTLVAALWRVQQGHEPLAPDPALDHAANYLWMLHGELPTPPQVRALTRYLILTAEHGMNASTFTARVIASTGADVVSAVAGAAGALSGPLHGGAPSLGLDMLDAIGAPERAVPWVAAAVLGGRRLMGFGHRVYRAEDPRAACLRVTAAELGGPRVALAAAVETAALATLRAAKPERALFTNVEFWSAIALERAGLPRPLFTPTFCAARTVGWTAHVLEQIADNRLIRPAAKYVGPLGRRLG